MMLSLYTEHTAEQQLHLMAHVAHPKLLPAPAVQQTTRRIEVLQKMTSGTVKLPKL